MIKFLSNAWSNFKEYVILCLLVILSLILLSQNQNQKVQKVRAIAFGSFSTVTSVFSNLFSSARITEENEELRKANAELMMQISKLREYGITNEQLRGLIGLKDTANLPLIPATVVSKSLSLTQHTITLNAGLKDSVKPGMPVVNYSGLIGMVHSSSENFSIVRTLKNVDLKLTVKNERSRIHGIMKWDGEEFIIVNIPKTYDFEIGDRIITSELSSIVPVPLPVGLVQEIDDVETEVFKRIKVRPFVDLLSVENLFIVGIVNSTQKQNLELNFYR
ncbi:MAG TPA: rod shape-determining protein MreC [Ignavibacteriaceae bacterium]|nr:rod shape-determining protein MreC [Ignavibacteriaceae bacterium]